MKNINAPTEKTNSLDDIRRIMAQPSPVTIVPREVQVDESQEFTGRNTDAARRIFREETGES